MSKWIMEFYEHIWHQYWTVLDLFIVVFILYQLRRLNSIIKNQKNIKDEK